MVALSELHARAARARIAEVMDGGPALGTLGSIVLRPHQRVAVARVIAQLHRHRCCLLADDVGRGKTYVALAVARRWHRPLLIIPASLRDTWRDALHRAAVTCPLITHEALSRGASVNFSPDGAIIDESHRFRSTSSRRHAAVATVLAHAEVVMLSATPLQNSSRDLAAQLSLVLGSGAMLFSSARLARHVVRGVAAAGESDGLPPVAPPRWLRPLVDDAAVLRAILGLPSPARPLDAGRADVLRTVGLVRAWASSRAALAAAIRSRRRIATAMEQCVAAGRIPTLADLRAWRGGDEGVVQLGFAALLADVQIDDPTAAGLRRDLAADLSAIAEVERAMRADGDPDAARAAIVRQVRRDHPGERVLAFTGFATTARALYARMQSDKETGLLTARDARIASGRIARREMLARFAPVSQGASPPSELGRVTLLIATDVLSEGMNLQDASVVVHLDLPWNPARLAQRVGRVRRPGGRLVSSYLLAPPADTELVLAVERRLRSKLAAATNTVGRALVVVPDGAMNDDDHPPSASDPDQDVGRLTADEWAHLLDRVDRWRRPARATNSRASRCIVALVESEQSGWLAALEGGRLVGSIAGERPDESLAPRVMVACCDGRASSGAHTNAALALARAQTELAAWMNADHARDLCGVGDQPPVVLRLQRRMGSTLRSTERHRTAQLVHRIATLRNSLARPLSLGVERALEALDQQLASEHRSASDGRWVDQAIAVVGASASAARPTVSPSIAVMIVLVPPETTDAQAPS